MPFPKVNYCLVCENVRAELGGKLSILGFFGVTPSVDVGVAKLDQPLALMVVFGFGVVEDVGQLYNYSVSFINPDGSVLAETPPAPINVVAGRPGVVATTMMAVPRVPGLRTVKLIINGQTGFEGKFLIRQARPDELAGIPGAKVH